MQPVCCRSWSRPLLLGALLVLAPALAAGQSFSSGSTGADGPFAPTSNVTLPLPPSGVFHFTTISIPSTVTVRFTKNAANTPVVLLATGSVVINGLLEVNGADATAYGRPGIGGPGGFHGGAGADGLTSATGSYGLGPGGGGPGTGSTTAPGGGGYATPGGGSLGGPAYGSPAIRPILGGSGGGGGGGALGTAIGGGAGTLTELAFAWIHRRLVIAFRVPGWSGRLAGTRIDDRVRFRSIPDDQVFGVDTPEEALAVLSARLPSYRANEP